jgi:hypothetical protein
MTFLELTDKELADWREQPISKHLVDWWSSWIALGKDTVVAMASRGDAIKAAAVAGRVQALEELLSAVTAQRSERQAIVEEFFVDPAARTKNVKNK